MGMSHFLVAYSSQWHMSDLRKGYVTYHYNFKSLSHVIKPYVGCQI